MSPSPLRLTLAAAALAVALVPLANCSTDTQTVPPSSGSIGPAGGALASADYVIELLVPPGALSSTVTFTITPVSTPGTSGTNAPAYTITSSNGSQTFASPVVVSYTEQAVSAANAYNDPIDYRVAAYESGAWAPLANPSVDALADTLEGTTTALSTGAYSVIVPAAGSVCNTVTPTCAGDAGCAPPSCDTPSLPGKCAAYPGSVTAACAAGDAGVVTVSCCYPTGAPVCFTQSVPNCNDPCTKIPGSTAVSCIPDVGPPLTNGSNGGVSVATCCLPAGTTVDGGPVVADAGADSAADAGGRLDASAPSDASTGPDASDASSTDASTGADASDAGTGADASGTDASGTDASDAAGD